MPGCNNWSFVVQFVAIKSIYFSADAAVILLGDIGAINMFLESLIGYESRSSNHLPIPMDISWIRWLGLLMIKALIILPSAYSFIFQAHRMFGVWLSGGNLVLWFRKRVTRISRTDNRGQCQVQILAHFIMPINKDYISPFHVRTVIDAVDRLKCLLHCEISETPCDCDCKGPLITERKVQRNLWRSFASRTWTLSSYIDPKAR